MRPVSRITGILVCAAMIASVWSVVPAAARSPSKAGAYGHGSFRHSCRPPLKFAAGACVRRCPAGYRDDGRTCRFRSKHN